MADQTRTNNNSEVKLNLNNIELECKLLFDSYSNNKSDTKERVDQLLKHIYNLSNGKIMLNEINDTTELSNIFEKIGEIMNIRFDVFEVKDVSDKSRKVDEPKILKQEMTNTSFKELFQKIVVEHIHKITCNGTLYSCDFHNESLFAHLHLAMITSYCHQPKDFSFDDKLKHCFVALFHDIGKFNCYQLINNGPNKWLGYAFHGEMGCGIMLQAFNHEFEKYFNKKEWQEMSRCISVHMCGYHEFDKNAICTKYKWELLRLENQFVKTALRYLSIADHFSALKDFALSCPNDIFFKSRDEMMDSVNKEFNVELFRSSYTLKHLVVMVRGMSGSGKSTFVKELIKFLTDNNIKFRYIERDRVMCQTVATILGEQFNPSVKVDPDTYNRYFNEYKTKNLGNRVNKQMNCEIDEGFVKREIVIIDTVMALFSGIDYALPSSAKNAFICAVDVIRGEIIDENVGKRMGLTVDEQVKLFTSKTMFKWTCEEAQFKAITSLSTARNFSNVRELSRPRLVHVITWNNERQLGYDEFYQNLNQLISPFVNKNNGEDNKESEEDLDQDMDIVEYANHLYKMFGWDAFLESFRSRGFMCMCPPQFKDTDMENRVVMIKYLESCFVWRYKWARQCRGVMLYLDNEDNIVCIKYQLPRGAEVLTGLHIVNGIDNTQDISIKHIDHLDDKQQQVIHKLAGRQAVDGYLSFKNDGSLLSVEFYSGKYYSVMENIINKYGDCFAKAILGLAKTLDCKFIPILSTQGTLFMSEHMQQYMVTSILDGLHIIDYDTLSDFAKNKTPADAITYFGIPFMERLNVFFGEIEKNNIHNLISTLSFEAICKNRQSCWKDLHTELAISYPVSMLRILGMSTGDQSPIFQPHFMFSEIINKIDIEEPLYWKTSHSVEIENMFTDLSKCIREQMTNDEFLKIHVPSNIRLPTNKYFDYEGFVFYATFDNELDYSKIKTEEYYKSHKFRVENIVYLLELAKTAKHIFPLCTVITEFYGALYDKLVTIVTNIMNNLNIVQLMKDDDSLLSSDKFYNGLSEKAKPSFKKQPDDVKYKILVNVSSAFSDMCFDEFVKEFPLLKSSVSDKSELTGTLKTIIMVCVPWINYNDDEYKTKLNKMIDEPHQVLRHLFNHINNAIPTVEQLQVE
jgi:Ni2+-binding GTPase involved in maturation of urease and hydrogenase